MNKNRDIIIVLGAHINGLEPTKALRLRLERALKELRANKNSICIVSGGQGSNEIKTEAEVMKAYLIKAGIDDNRIIMENKARSTTENLIYSKALLVNENIKLGTIYIVTNWYHGLRGLLIGKTVFNSRVKILGSKYLSWKLIKYIPREVLAYIKDYYLLRIKKIYKN